MATPDMQAKRKPLLRAARPIYRPFKGNCERCGQEYIVERGGHWRDSDYLELFHEHINLQSRFKAAVKFMVAVMRARNDPNNPANAPK